MNTNVSFVAKNSLCTGCGICEDICPTKSIKIILHNGRWIPSVNQNTCISHKGCSQCLKVCAGKGINLMETRNKLYSGGLKDRYAGLFRAAYTGYSTDENERYHAASGGLVSRFLIFLLDKKIIDGAIVTAFSPHDHITPHAYIARTKNEILQARGSKYCPVSMNKIGNIVRESTGRYIIVGLPCHIQGFRNRAKIDTKFREKVFGYFAIYCSSNRTFHAMDYLFRKYRVKKSDINYFAFRDEGYLGNMIIAGKNKISIGYNKYYGELHSYFKPRRCLSCIDHYGELADVCFGDIYISPYSKDTVGINSVLVRNEQFNEYILQARKSEYLTLDPLDIGTLNDSQAAMLYPQKRKVQALMNIDKLFGRPIAVYDCDLEKPEIKDYLSVLSTLIQCFIGSRHKLWGIITLLNKIR